MDSTNKYSIKLISWEIDISQILANLKIWKFNREVTFNTNTTQSRPSRLLLEIASNQFTLF